MSAGVGNRRWRIIGLFFLCYTVIYIARGSLSIAGPEMMKTYNWDPANYGLTSSGFFIGYLLTMYIGGALADKFGGTRVLCGGALLWSLFTFLTPYAPISWGIAGSLTFVIVVRALAGISQGVALPAMSSMVAKWVPKRESGIAQGVTLIGVAFGLAVVMPLGAWIVGLWGLKAMFIIFALLGPVWVALWLLFGYQNPQDDPHITKSELEYIQQTPAASTAQAATDLNKLDQELTMEQCKAMSAVWIGAVSMLATHYLFYFFMTWLPVYFAEARHMPLAKSAMSAALPYVAAMITYPLGGGLADWCSRKFGENVGRKLIPIIGLLISAVFLWLATTVESNGAATALISLSNGALCLTMGGYYSIPIVFSRKNAGKLVGIWATFATAGGILAPYLTGVWVQYFGYNFALGFAAATAFIAAILLCFVRIEPFAEILAARKNAAA